MRQNIKVPLHNLYVTRLFPLFANVVDRLKDNAYFPAPPIPIAALEAKRDALSAAITAAIGGGLVHRQLRDQLEQEAHDDLRLLAHYVRAVSKGNGVMLASSGFPLRKQPEPITEVGSPTHVVTRSSFKSNTILVRWGKAVGARMYRLERTENDPSQPDTVWTTVGLTGRQSMEVSGLVQFKAYFFRVVAMGSMAEGKASDVAMGRAV